MTNINPIKVLLCTGDSAFLQQYLDSLSLNYQVQTALSFDVAQFLLNEWDPEICVIKADLNSTKVISALRDQSPYFKLGIIVIANQLEPSYANFEFECFNAGADHFISHEADLLPLKLRIDSLTRKMRANHKSESNFLSFQPKGLDAPKTSYGPIEVFPLDFLIKISNKPIATTPTQFRLLTAFITHQEQLLSREWLKNTVWNDTHISPRTIDAQISKLKKLIPFLDKRLINIYGKGYILTQEQQISA